MLDRLSYRGQLLIGMCGLVLVTGAAITWLAYQSAKQSTELLAHSLFREVSRHAVTHTRAFLNRAEPLVHALTQLGEDSLALDDSDRLARQLLSILRANEGLSWVSFGDERGNFTGVYRPAQGGLRVNQSRIVDGKTRLIEHDVLADGSWKVVNENVDSGYDPRERPFYKLAKQENRLVWLPPYVFFNQGVPGISCAAPIHDEAGLRGVLSIDFDLRALSDFVAGLSLSEHSQIFLLAPEGVVLAHPKLSSSNLAIKKRDKLLTVAEVDDPLAMALYERVSTELSDEDDRFEFFAFRHDCVGFLGSTTSFRLGKDLTWIVGAIAPERDFLEPVWRSQKYLLAIATFGVLSAALVAAMLARHVSRPVMSLIDFMRRVGAGDLEAKANFGDSREFRELSAALNQMIVDLRDRLRLRHSLEIAMDVQQRLLPQTMPKTTAFDVAGHSTYCDETGGDYYDFLLISETSPDMLLVALGDVMGHGVAAALVMAGARAVLRDRADAAGELAEMMQRLNRLLASDLEGTRFMTMHLSIFDAHSGMFRWVSAGHDPAMIYDPANDTFQELDEAELPLGVVEDTEYFEHRFGPLGAGQMVFIGTDGVWEMPNEAGVVFGKERLRTVLRANAKLPAQKIVESLVQDLSTFRGECRQVDDVTFIVVKSMVDREAARSADFV